MSARVFLISMLLVFTGAFFSPARAGFPNVVLVITDDQGYGDIAAHGHPFVRTPNLDALHAASIRLEDYHVAPTCAPTRAALYTGHWTNRTGVWHTIQGRSMLREDEETIGDLFHDAGYATGFFGKWHLGDNHPYRPEERGFQEVVRHGGGGVGQTPDYWDNAYFDDTYWHNGIARKYEGHCTDVWFQAAREFIAEQVAQQRPFLAIVSTNAPHSPFHAPQKYADLYQGKLPGLSEKPLDKGSRHYFGMITQIDDNVGSMREFLAEQGVADETVFIFTTDNGTVKRQVFDGGMRGGKGSEYEGGHRVPFFVHYPAGELVGGRAVASLTAHVDVVPTLLDLCGIAPPPGVKFDGMSIRRLLEQGDAGWQHGDRVLITDSQRVKDPIKWKQSATMSGSYRLVNGDELYDVAADPRQETNIISAQPKVAERLRTAYEAWWKELEPSFARTTRINIGHPGENPARLTSHDWVSTDLSPWNQGMIREAYDAPGSQGPWAVQVVETGDYRIELRRWPEEADHPIDADLPGAPGVPGSTSARTRPGAGIAARECVLVVGGREYRKPVAAGDRVVVFDVVLEAGPDELVAKFIRKDGSELGAYFAYVSRIGRPGS